jgi:hypothetical protein
VLISGLPVCVSDLSCVPISEYGVTPQREGPSMDEEEDARRSFSALENQKKRKNRK